MNNRRAGAIAARHTMKRGTATIVALGLMAAALLGACHPLVNPVDPNSTAYTGTPTNGDGSGDGPEPLLPSADKWELATDHAPGRMLPLEITDDGLFVEPRQAGWFELWITLSDSFQYQQADGAILWIAVTDFGNIYYAVSGIPDVAPEQRLLVVRFSSGIPNKSMIRLRLTDRNGTFIGERLFGYLIGDVDRNGTVDGPDDRAAITALGG